MWHYRSGVFVGMSLDETESYCWLLLTASTGQCMGHRRSPAPDPRSHADLLPAQTAQVIGYNVTRYCTDILIVIVHWGPLGCLYVMYYLLLVLKNKLVELELDPLTYPSLSMVNRIWSEPGVMVTHLSVSLDGRPDLVGAGR